MTNFKPLMLLMSVVLGCLSSFAFDFEVDGIYYNILSSTNVEVTFKTTDYNSYTGDVVIPSTVTDNDIAYNVSAIGDRAFMSCRDMTAVVIPTSVTDIGVEAFSSCEGLVSVEIPNTVTIIRDYAFAFCYALTSIKIPDSVLQVGDRAFYWCTSLETSEIGRSVIYMGDSAFAGCTSMTTVKFNAIRCGRMGSGPAPVFYRCDSFNELIIGDAVECLPSHAFDGCIGLTSVLIPTSVTELGEGVFWDCRGLTSVVIPTSVNEIGDCAFLGCTNLASVEFNATHCTYMGSSSNPVFELCESLTDIAIGENVEIIPPYAFKGCAGLTSIELTASVTEICEGSFSGCTGLTKLEIPGTVKSIGKSAFSASTLTGVWVSWEDPANIDVNKSAITSVKNTILYVPRGTIDKYKTLNPWKSFKEIVEYAPGTSGMPSLDAKTPVRVYAIGEQIQIEGTLSGDTVQIYQIDGTLINSTEAMQGTTIISQGLQKGKIYIVKSGDRIIKYFNR